MIEKVILIVSMLIVFYISVNSVQKFNLKYENLDAIINEFKSGYVSDIKLNENSCSPGYESLIQKFDWPGNYRGCGCLEKNGEYEFYPLYCPSGCKEVNETSPRQFNKWKGKVICLKREQIFYKDLPLIEYNNKVSCMNETHKICGKVDGKDNLLCVEKDWECPITEFVITQTHNINDTHYLKYELSNNYTLYANKKNSTNIIPVLFRVDSTQPCLDPSLSPSSEYFFPLMKKRRDLICDTFENGTEITDYYYQPMDSFTLDEYLQDNGFYKDVHKLIDPFNINITNNNIKIYSKSYPGWDLKCRVQDQLVSFINLPDELNVLVISIILHSLITILSLICIAVFACFFNKYYELLFKLVNVCFCIINFIFPIQIISNSNWIINMMSDEDGNLCGDEVVNIILSGISNASLDLQYSFMIIIFITIVYCIFLIYTLYKWIKPYNTQYQLTYSKMQEMSRN
jgi:hypothetical protein